MRNLLNEDPSRNFDELVGVFTREFLLQIAQQKSYLRLGPDGRVQIRDDGPLWFALAVAFNLEALTDLMRQNFLCEW